MVGAGDGTADRDRTSVTVTTTTDEARPPEPLRVLLADDQAMVRAGFKMIIDSQPDLTVVAEADNGRTAVEMAQRIRPDVCILDIRMPVLDGLAATRLLAGPDVERPLKVVIATTFDSDEYVEIALRNGAAGFILKDSGPQLLLEAIRAAAVGDALISPSITVRYLDRFVTRRVPQAAAHPLSERELDIARAVAKGLSNQEIGTALYISLSTVKTHLTSIQLKLHLRNRVEIAIWVLEHDPARPGP
jgi:DNA-binding NarL/FixJ family response regulator